jgi:hypothetical protein
MRFLSKIGHFLSSWAFLKLVLAVIAIAMLLYVEEDWRGAHAWAVTKAKWEARGESFDLQKFIPPQIPDSQNLAADPLFKPEASSPNDTAPYPITLQKILYHYFSPSKLPRLGNSQKGELPDLPQIKDVLTDNYRIAFPDTPPPHDLLVLFGALYPFVADLRAASAQRPHCRLKLNYDIRPPRGRPLGPLTGELTVSKILTLHAILALYEHQPDLALADLKVNFSLLSGAIQDPSIVGGLVAIGMNAISGPAIFYGLNLHSWTDAQLAETQTALGRIDFLAAYQFSMRAEAVTSIENFEYAQKKNAYHFPSGWWGQNKSRLTDALLISISSMDPPAHRAFPLQYDRLMEQVRQSTTAWDRYAPWKIFYSISAGPILNGTIHFAQAQVWIDETRIALALERYGLAHGAYPTSLDQLAPTCIPSIPHDIINGNPYIYRLRPDGTFLLYSVGWNQTDNGGQVVFRQDAPQSIDFTQGDWVWPVMKTAP